MSLVRKPATIEEYVEWARNTLGVDFESEDCLDAYNMNMTNVHTFASDSLLNSLHSFVDRIGSEYEKISQSSLFMSETDIKWHKKPYESFLNKSFRQNILWNQNWPNAPKYRDEEPEWVTPDNWFLKFNDTVRTMLVCKYIDGPKYFVERLDDFVTTDLKLSCHYDSRQKDDGYYAYHLYIKLPVVLYTGTGLTKSSVEIEIQISTQLQEVLNKITHSYYEQERISYTANLDTWKWETHTNKFRVAYLRHTLHLLEAIILEARHASFKTE